MKFDKMFCNGKSAPLGIGCEAVLHWNYRNNGCRGEKQEAFRVILRKELAGSQDNIFDSGRVVGNRMQYHLSDLQPGTIYTWQVVAYTQKGEVVSPEQTFETAIDDLGEAAWLVCGDATDSSAGCEEDAQDRKLLVEKEPAAPVFIKHFAIPGKLPVRARAYVYGLGLIRPQINGTDCADAYLMPSNSVYDRHCYFETFDITGLLQKGENTFTVQLGNGYNSDYSQYGYRYFLPKGLRASILLEYAEGTGVTVSRIDTDDTWHWTDSCVTANGLYLGEDYDARIKDLPEYPVVVDEISAPKGQLLPNEMPRIKVIRTLESVQNWEVEGGVLYDFGCNIQGISQIEVEAAAGCQLTMQHCEMILPDGKPDLETNRQARAMETYICSGEGREVYAPYFTYHGFRYVFVKGTEQTKSFRITALQLSADVSAESDFLCSEPIVNRIHELCTRSIRSNLTSIPTDCPVRDERTPCLMDSQMYEDAAMYNFNMYAYYKKWLDDIVPLREAGEGNMDWNGDCIMLAYRLYLFYGDAGPVKKYYEKLKASVVSWVEEGSDNGVWEKGFGDWCMPNNGKWDDYFGCVMGTNTSLLYAYTGIMARLAEDFGYKEDHRLFLTLGEKVRKGLLEKYYHEDGIINNGRQPELVLPLFYGLLEGEAREKTRKALIEKVMTDGYFDTGGFGTRAMLPILAETDEIDLALEVLRRSEYPGYGWWVAAGATSLWEQWAYRGDMHSHSHAMHSGIDAAFYHVFCGVEPVTPGFERFRIRPCLPKEMNFCQCTIDSYAGKIYVRVEKINDGLTMQLEIPPNTEAEVIWPEMDREKEYYLFDGERRISREAECTANPAPENNGALNAGQWTMTLGSGKYCLRLVPVSYIRQLYE